MKDKKYIDCLIVTHSGKKISNPLKLGEVTLLSKILHENATVICSIKTVSQEQYKSIFG